MDTNGSTKELLIKDLSSRLPYDVKVLYDNKVFSIDYVSSIYEEIKLDTCDNYTLDVSDVKPYLRPMSSMTEEEAKELSILCNITDILSIKITDEYIDFEVDDGFSSIETKIIWYNDIISSIETFDWLNKNHFDYRNLIQIGSAIAVTKENNPYE